MHARRIPTKIVWRAVASAVWLAFVIGAAVAGASPVLNALSTGRLNGMLEQDSKMQSISLVDRVVASLASSSSVSCRTATAPGIEKHTEKEKQKSHVQQGHKNMENEYPEISSASCLIR